jgi:hypothetical protein
VTPKPTQEILQVQKQVQVAPWIEPTALPRFTALLESSSEVGYLACTLLDPSDFMCPQDHVLAAFVPKMEGLIRRYYRSRSGVPLVRTFSPYFVARLDATLAENLPRYVLVWRATEWTVLQQEGGSTRKAVAAFKALLLQNDILGMV